MVVSISGERNGLKLAMKGVNLKGNFMRLGMKLGPRKTCSLGRKNDPEERGTMLTDYVEKGTNGEITMTVCSKDGPKAVKKEPTIRKKLMR